MALGGSSPQINLGVQGVTQRGHHSGAQRVNPELRVGSNFRIIPEQYFSAVENVVEFLENMEKWRETRGNNRYVDTSRPRREFNRFESQGVGDNQRLDGRRRDDQSDHRFPNQGGLQGGSRNSSFRALWDTGAEKSFISEEVYRKYFSYRPRQKTKDRVVTAQGAPCCHLGRLELQIRIREFQKVWEFHILINMQ
ncbi:uncharacterized protein TNCV_1761361 [Trichonephila clavipes]|nr:uncharacterized protein TNCV_1761361 [Trichonephila clavipes]